MKIILASASPRRREILSELGIDFEVIVSETDESSNVTDPRELVQILSLRKGKAVRDMLIKSGHDVSDTLIISSDTVVYCDGRILGKPKDREDAARMMKLMSGRRHSVLSGIAVCLGDKCASDVSETFVSFAAITPRQLEFYLDHSAYSDKAGAYAIQQDAALFIDKIEGDYFTVVGLPVRKLCTLLDKSFGIDMQKLTHKK